MLGAVILKELSTLPRDGTEVPELSRAATYLRNCRSFDQFCSTLRGLIDPVEFCPFCEVEMVRSRRKKLAESGGWALVENHFPHSSTKEMLLIVPRRHVLSPHELRPEDWRDIGLLFDFGTGYPDRPGGGLFLRFGDPNYHAGSVNHLHFNIIFPILGEEYRPPFTKSEAERASDHSRLLCHVDELTKYGGASWLFSDEAIRRA